MMIRIICGLMILLLATLHSANAQKLKLADELYKNSSDSPGDVVRIEDGTLRDVAFVTPAMLLAVGDQNAVLKSTDYGKTWDYLTTPTFAHWRTISIVSPTEFYVGGYALDDVTSRMSAKLIHTTDAGVTWEQIYEVKSLTSIMYAKIDSSEMGVIISGDREHSPSGLSSMMTQKRQLFTDGIKVDAYWNGGAFSDAENGILFGRRGKVITYRESGFASSGVKTLTNVDLRGAVVLPDRSGWVCGDKGNLFHTKNNGIEWKPVSLPLPVDARQHFNLLTVTGKALQDVWVAGSPGTLIFKSQDGGESWVPHYTPTPHPLHKITFINSKQGVAVGEHGTILLTTDGGVTWNLAHRGNTFLAMQSINGLTEIVDNAVLAKYGKERGYRMGVMSISRDDWSKPGDGTKLAYHPARQDLVNELGILDAGGVGLHYDSGFPLDLPELSHDTEKLFSRWNKATDNKAAQLLVQAIVKELRMTRPQFVLLSAETKGDGLTALMNQAVIKSVELAGDKSAYPEMMSFFNLPPWEVKRVYRKHNSPQHGGITIDPYEPLPALNTSVMNAVRVPNLLLNSSKLDFDRPVSYELLTMGDESHELLKQSTDFFAGYPIMPGTKRRRKIISLNEDEISKLHLQSRQLKQFANNAELAKTTMQQAQVIQQLNLIMNSMPEKTAALFLEKQWWRFIEQNRVDLALDVARDLDKRYPKSGSAYRANLWRYKVLASEEMMVWQLKHITTHRGVAKTKIETTSHKKDSKLEERENNIIKKLGYALDSAQADVIRKKLREQPEFMPHVDESHPPKITRSWNSQYGEINTAELNKSMQEAIDIATSIKTRYPERFSDPENLAILASLLRKREQFDLADDVLRSISHKDSPDWNRAARAELWTTLPVNLPPQLIVDIPFTSQKPYLDGEMADSCWEQAQEIPIHAHEVNETGIQGRSLMWMCYDTEYLYVMISSKKQDAVALLSPTVRTHDAEITGSDRWKLSFDIDRDFATYFTFEVNGKGETRDSCAGYDNWNPKWYVSSSQDHERYRLELAIPFEEITLRSPAKGDIWRAHMIHVLPQRGIDSWMPVKSMSPTPDSTGLFRFN